MRSYDIAAIAPPGTDSRRAPDETALARRLAPVTRVTEAVGPKGRGTFVAAFYRRNKSFIVSE